MVVGTGWRRWIWLGGFLLISLWTFTYIRSLKTEIEVLSARLDKSLKTSDSLATQLQVVNTHKEKVEQFLESARKTNEEKLQELRQENRQLKERLETCNQSAKDSLSTSAAILTKVDLSANGDLAPKAVLPPPEEPISDQSRTVNSTDSGPNNSTTIHNYVGEFSAHFHRQQPANMDMEFRRDPENKAAEMDSQKAVAPPISMPVIKKQRLKGRRKGGLEKADKDVFEPKGAEKMDEENPVVDYRHAPKADENVADYKEMPDR